MLKTNPVPAKDVPTLFRIYEGRNGTIGTLVKIVTTSRLKDIRAGHLPWLRENKVFLSEHLWGIDDQKIVVPLWL